VAINSSAARAKPLSSEQILLGFSSVRGIGDDLAKAIVAEREANGVYRSLPDVLRRTGMPRNAAEHLISIGALAEFGLGRRELLWQLGLLIPSVGMVGRSPSRVGVVGRSPSRVGAIAASHTRAGGPPTPAATLQSSDETSRQASHRPHAPWSEAERGSRDLTINTKRRIPQRQLSLALPTEQDMVQLKDMTDWERMVADYGLLGLSPSYHPLALLRRDLPADVLNAEQVRASRDGARVRTAGLVVCRQRPGTAKGFVFLLLEDETGLVNIVVRPDLYEAQRSIIRGEPYLCIEGTVQLHSGSLNLLAIKATPLGQLTAEAMALPRAPERNGMPGNPHDKREAASAELVLATPASRDFH
jgi:error-prone DNA polymerase